MADHDEDFFIGWAGPSRRGLVFLVTISVLLIAVFAGSAAAITQLQSSPGASERSTTEYVGVFYKQPYGHLVVPTDDGPATVLLSSGGKNGLQRSFQERDGEVVKAKGFGLIRDDRRALELWGALAPAELPEDQLTAIQAASSWEALGPVTLRGEIVDSKCYYGRMRPGSGKGHRACAQLCIRGGIPPVLVTVAPNGERTHVLVTGPGRSDIHEEVVEYAAEPVTVEGVLWRRGDLLAVEFDPATSITREWPDLR